MNDINPLHQLTEIFQLKDMYNKYGPLPCNFCDNQTCINYVMGSVYCLLYVGLDISTVVMELRISPA